MHVLRLRPLHALLVTFAFQKLDLRCGKPTCTVLAAITYNIVYVKVCKWKIYYVKAAPYTWFSKIYVYYAVTNLEFYRTNSASIGGFIT